MGLVEMRAVTVVTALRGKQASGVLGCLLQAKVTVLHT
jgi:hypothetical protein